MKKKKQKSSAITTTTTTADLKAQIREHSLFFDKLIELIPARFYLPNDDADSKPWYQGLSKAAKASLKQQTKENIKLARRHRLDPDKVSQSSTLDLLNQSLQKQSHPQNDVVGVEANLITFDESHENINNNNNNNSIGSGDDRAVTYEELREKLRKKIESLRGNRGGSSEKRNENKGNQEKKRKRDDGESGKIVEEKAKNWEKVDEGIEYGKVKIGDEEKRKKKKRKMSKAKELERAKRLEEVKKENPFVAEKQSWKAATSRAMGQKVHNDPRLLKESLKKEKRRKEKNAEKWKERAERTEKMKEERQQKRKNNIAERAREKKDRKIAKREKKLMRPGFEGRKEGYITQD